MTIKTLFPKFTPCVGLETSVPSSNKGMYIVWLVVKIIPSKLNDFACLSVDDD